jgi:hypothetical protein
MFDTRSLFTHALDRAGTKAFQPARPEKMSRNQRQRQIKACHIRGFPRQAPSLLGQQIGQQLHLWAGRNFKNQHGKDGQPAQGKQRGRQYREGKAFPGFSFMAGSPFSQQAGLTN